MNLKTFFQTRNALLQILLSLSFLASPMQSEDTQSLAVPVSDDGLPGEGPIRRYDWFKNLWLKKRTEWADLIEQDQNSVVFLGDSITQGWNDSFRDHFKHLKKSNRGISGDTTRGVLIRMQEDVLSLNPSGIVLLIGTNDLEEGARPRIIAGNVNLILKKLQNHRADMPIILCKLFPSDSSKNRPASSIIQINEHLQNLAKNYPMTKRVA